MVLWNSQWREKGRKIETEEKEEGQVMSQWASLWDPGVMAPRMIARGLDCLARVTLDCVL
eukprot:SAG11_NODE_21618_length_421_cov_2.909938_1_plen_60_part_00